MKKNKKNLAILLVIALSFSMYINTSAKTINENQDNYFTYVVNNDKIVNQEVLLNRALSGEHDAPQQVVEVLEENSVLIIDGIIQDETPLLTTELLSTRINDTDDSEQISTYAATIISEMEIDNNMLRSSIYTKQEQAAPDGGEIYLYTTIRFEVGETNGVGYIKLLGVNVDVDINVSRIKVEYVKARYGYKGVNSATHASVNYTSSWTQNSGTTLDVTCSNPPRIECIEGGVYYEVWGEGLAHVVRGGSSWDTKHKVLENDMGWYL